MPLIDLDEVDEEKQAEEEERRGFLPIHTNAFDRGFIGAVLFVAIHLLWMRFVGHLLPVATVISLALAAIIIARG